MRVLTAMRTRSSHASSPRPRPPTREPRAAWVRVAAAATCVAGLTAAAADARAQSCGGCAAPGAPAGGAQRSWLARDDWTARVTSELEVRDRTFRGHRRVVNDFDETLRIRRVSLSLRYGLTDDWTAGLDLSHPEFRYRLKPPGGRRTDLTVRGPGDMVLRVGRRFTRPDDGPIAYPRWDAGSGAGPRAPLGGQPIDVPTLSAWAGVSIPTGDVRKPNASVVNRDFSVSNLQTGTGTFDPVLNVRLDLPLGAWRAFADASAVLPFAENRHDYRTGATIAFAVGAEHDLGDAVRARLTTTFQRIGNDEFRGEAVGVGGGKWVYVTPGFAWDMTERATLDVGVRCTLLRDTDTKLVDSGVALQIGLTIRF